MGSIRPLVTITILLVVGVYLFRTINQGPVQPNAGADKNWNHPPDGVPPLTSTNGASLSKDSTAPAWPPSTTSLAPGPAVAPPLAATAPSAPAGGTAPAANTPKDGLPAVPPIPELPEFPVAANATPPGTSPAAAPSKDLPVNIPTARYPDDPNKTPATGANKENINLATPAKSTATADADNLLFPPTVALPPATTATPAQTPVTGTAPSQPATNGLGSTPPTSGPQASTQNPLRASADPITPVAPAATVAVAAQPGDRYALNTPTTSPAAPPTTIGATPPLVPIETSFAASWPAIQAALDRRDLKQAHQLLSKWHNNDSLTAAEAQRVESLLGQLAGTVIYSNEHQLEPARVVKPGETLDTIAKEYNVPWQLLAKINNVASPDRLRAGQELKVVRGPFSAVVDLRRSDLTLMVDDRYAGKFRFTVPAGTNLAEGQWIVDQKLAGPPNTANPRFAATPVPADRSIILRNTAAGGPPTLIISSGSVPVGLATSPPSLRVSPQDAEDMSDILSVGSRVTVRK